MIEGSKTTVTIREWNDECSAWPLLSPSVTSFVIKLLSFVIK